MKVLKIIGIIIGVVLLLMILIPYIFKDQITGIVKNEVNKNVNAVVDFKDAGLNLFEHFPNLTLNIDNLTIVNKKPFEGDTLLNMDQFEAEINIWKAIAGQYVVESINLNQPDIFVYVLKDSTANYNIMKENTTEVKDTANSSSGMKIALNYYSINNANIAYIDQTSDMVVVMNNLNHSGSGNMSSENFVLNTVTDIERLTFEYNGIKYLNGVNTHLDMNIDANIPNKKFTLKDNSLRLNNLVLKMNGFVAMPDTNKISMDLTFGSERSNFKDIISLIPAVYSENFKDLKSSGEMLFSGYAKGVYTNDRLPAFNVKLNVNNGSFQYPKLPTPVNKVNVDLAISNPGGNKDNTIIDLKNLHFELGSEPFNAKLLVKNPVTTPYIETQMNGKIDLAKLRNALTLKDVTNLAGIITADFKAKGTISKVKEKTIENIIANGQVSFSNIQYGSKSLPQDVNVSQAQITLSSQNINLNSFNMKIGKNDLEANGGLTNVFSYILSNGTVKGNLSLKSNYFDVNPFMTSEKPEGKADTSQQKLEAVELPENVNFTMKADFNKLIYDNLTLQNVKGTIVLANSRLDLNNLMMNLLGGSINTNGYYSTQNVNSPKASFNFKIKNFDIGETYKSFVTVRQFAPMAKYINGLFDAQISMTTPLTQNMMPVWNMFDASGSLNLQRAEIKGFKPLVKVGDALNIDAIKNPSLSNINPSFQIDNGRFNISPVKFKVQNYNVTFGGSNGIDQSIDYVMGVSIPATNLKNQANKAINSLLKKDVDLVSANTVEVKAIMKGKINDPVISTSVGSITKGTAENVQSQVKEQINSEIEKKKEEAQKKVEQKADTLKEQLKKEAEKKLKDIFKFPK